MSSILSLLFRSTFGGSGIKSQLGLLTLDVTIEEVHERSARVTEFPIEGGGNINDHVSLRPKVLRIKGLVTDTPFEDSGFALGRSRASSAYFTLEQMWQLRIPFICYTQSAVYGNMVIETLSLPKSAESALTFDATLRQLTIVSGQNSIVPTSVGGSLSPSPAISGLGGGVAGLVSGNVSLPEVAAMGIDVGRQAVTQATAGIAAKARGVLSAIGVGI